MELDKAIQSVKNVANFNDKKPDWRDIIECIDSARFALMAGDNYTLKFVIVDDKEKIQGMTDATQQSFISQAHYIVVVCSNPSRTANAYGEGAERYLRQQAGAGIQNFLLKLLEKELSTCWVRFFVEKQIKKILSIPEKINVEAIFPIGYESFSYNLTGKLKKSEKFRIDLDRILYFNKYGNKKMKKIKGLDV